MKTMKNYLWLLLLVFFSMPVMEACGDDEDDLYEAVVNGDVSAEVKDEGSKISFTYKVGDIVETIECVMNGGDASSVCTQTIYKFTYPSKDLADYAWETGVYAEFIDASKSGKTITCVSDEMNGMTRSEILAAFNLMKEGSM